MNFSKNKILCSLLLSSTFSAHAAVDQDHLYVGLGLATGSGDEYYENSYTETEYDLDQNQTEIKIGYQFPSQKRIEFSLTTIEAEVSNVDVEYSGMDVDWYFPFQLRDSKIQPFLGVGFGFYEYEDTSDLFQNGDNLDGIAINLMGGLFIPASDRLEFELAYKNKTITWKTVEFNGQEIDSGVRLNSIVLAARFKF
ncbi:MAG: outer membrane beta-barrel protein [Gammaproteobacteria bacterium]|nr:outer membrane beta-barrel protein [Gammaproteobacteria bacterium]